MEPKQGMSFQLKVAVISAITAIIVFFVIFAVMAVVYYSICCEPVGRATDPPTGESVPDRIELSGRTLTGSTTDADEITSVFFTSWSHAGPLYPRPQDLLGYVSSRTVEFRRGLSALRESRKDYDRDLPDEVSKFSATLTDEQFENLVRVCAQNDIANEPDSTNRRSEGESMLVIEYSGEKRSILTSNMGIDTPTMKAVLEAIEALEKSVSWSKVELR